MKIIFLNIFVFLTSFVCVLITIPPTTRTNITNEKVYCSELVDQYICLFVATDCFENRNEKKQRETCP